MSVVIPVRNGAALLAQQLESLVHQEVAGGFEVVVVDNGSSDGTAGVAVGFADRLELRVVEDPRPGVSNARNSGVAAARAEAVVFLDHDDRVEPGYLEAMRVAIGESQLAAARIVLEELNPEGAAREVPQVTGLGQGWLPWAYGATLGISRELYDRIGGCDPGLRFASEDIDLCWRAQLAGARLRWVPEAVLHYRVHHGSRALFQQGRRYGRGGVQVDRRFRAHGQAAPSVGLQVRQLAMAVWRLVTARSAVQRDGAAFLLGRRVGNLTGLLRRDPCRAVLPDGRLSRELVR